MVGEASGPAEAFGVRAGMRLGEALARCPDLALVPPDPERAEAAWEDALRRLEGIGAEVESERPGEAFFEADGLRGLSAASRERCARGAASDRPPGRGSGPAHAGSAAYAAAQRARAAAGARWSSPRRWRDFLAPLPVGLLRDR